jgi:hypothetical protein
MSHLQAGTLVIEVGIIAVSTLIAVVRRIWP